MSLMFSGAGSMMRSYKTKDIGAITEVGRRFPVVGALWLAGAVAITGAPPFGLFASEFTILRAGLRSTSVWAAIVTALLVLGLWWPHVIWRYFGSIAHALQGAAPLAVTAR